MKKTIILGILGLLIGYMLIRVYSGPDTNTSIMLRFGATVLAGVYAGFLAVAYLLPIFTNKVSDMVFSDSGQTAAPDGLATARGLVAQGEYEAAIQEYTKAIEKDPENRLAWTDVAKIYADKLEQPELAVATYRSAYDNMEWSEEDAAFFLFRISEWQLDELDDRDAGIATLEEVRAAYPETRHSANATNQLRQLGVEPKEHIPLPTEPS